MCLATSLVSIWLQDKTRIDKRCWPGAPWRWWRPGSFTRRGASAMYGETCPRGRKWVCQDSFTHWNVKCSWHLTTGTHVLSHGLVCVWGVWLKPLGHDADSQRQAGGQFWQCWEVLLSNYFPEFAVPHCIYLERWRQATWVLPLHLQVLAGFAAVVSLWDV